MIRPELCEEMLAKMPFEEPMLMSEIAKQNKPVSLGRCQQMLDHLVREGKLVRQMKRIKSHTRYIFIKTKAHE